MVSPSRMWITLPVISPDVAEVSEALPGVVSGQAMYLSFQPLPSPLVATVALWPVVRRSPP